MTNDTHPENSMSEPKRALSANGFKDTLPFQALFLTQVQQHAVAGCMRGTNPCLTVSMKAMVTYNLETDLDITNGVWGEIVGIMLDEKEEVTSEEPIHELKRMPAYILVKLAQARLTALHGFSD